MFPLASADALRMKWDVKTPVLTTETIDKPICMYGNTYFTGKTSLSPEGYAADGKLRFGLTEFDSDYFAFDANTFVADSADFLLYTADTSTVAFSATNYRANVDFDSQKVQYDYLDENSSVSNGQGRVYGYGRSIWAMIDTETRQPSDIYSIDNGAINDWIVDDKPCPIEKGGRVKMSDDAELIRSIEVNYNDIDINGHVNSVKYIEHVLDLWDVAWYGEHSLKRFEIAYVAETHQGDTMNFYREQVADNEFCVRLTKTEVLTQKETEVCRCRLVF